jgi:hypothetical protein
VRIKYKATHGAPRRAPIKVPIESRPTIAPDRTTENSQESAVEPVQVPKRRRKSSMRRMSEI